VCGPDPSVRYDLFAVTVRALGATWRIVGGIGLNVLVVHVALPMAQNHFGGLHGGHCKWTAAAAADAHELGLAH